MSRVAKAAAGVGVAIVMLLSLEALARIMTTLRTDWRAYRSEAAEPDAANAWLEFTPDLGWRRRPGYRGVVGFTQREFDAEGYLAIDSQDITARLPRIVFIGDSNTFGFGVESREAFPEVTDHLLPDAVAINLGVMGYSSYQGRLVAEKALLLEPAALVVSFNFNDRRSATQPDGPDAFLDLYEQSQRATRREGISEFARALERLHAYRYLARALRGRRDTAGGPIRTVAVEALAPRVDETRYADNLTWIATEGRRRDIPVFFVALKDNPVATANINRGLDYLQSETYDRAIAYFSEAARTPNDFQVLSQVQLASALRLAGENDAIGRLTTTEQFSFDGTVPVRLDRAYNDIMRRVAREHGATVIEAGALLDEHPEEYLDECHFDARGHRRVAGLVAAIVRQVALTK